MQIHPATLDDIGAIMTCEREPVGEPCWPMDARATRNR